MNNADGRFLRRVYEKVEAIRRRRRRVAFIAAGTAGAVALSVLCVLSRHNLLLLFLAGGLLLALLTAMDWLSLVAVKGGQDGH